MDGEFGADVIQQAQASLDMYRLDYWSDARAKRLQADLVEMLSLRDPSSLDVAQARSATLEAYAAAGAAMAAKFGASPKALEDLTALAARFAGIPQGQVAAQNEIHSQSETRSTRNVSAASKHEAPITSDKQTDTALAEAHKDGVKPKGDNIMEFARQ